MYNIIGHKNPDTDATCSAIAYQNFLTLNKKEAKAFVLGKINKETEFVLNKFKIDQPSIIEKLKEGEQVILVDHNEKKQTIENIDELNLTEIIDHHKVDIKTEKPISILIKPWGSTASIITDMFFKNNFELDYSVAGILLSAIISDTLFFRSPTTIEKDKELVEKLNKIVNISDLNEYSLQMFNAKSDLGDISVEELIKLDYKVFDFKDGAYGIGVMETTNVDYALKRKKEILDKLNSLKTEDNLKAIYFIVVDILKQEAFIFSSDKEAKELFRKIFKADDQAGLLFVKGLVSRKKQIVPVFENM